ncbi:MAG: metallophosphoesterase [Defluviitaleaceae bacterium]|nr:metallophosphoesterase [Defluviitaleaceae bacterium]
MKTHRKLKIFLIVLAALIVAGVGYFKISGWAKGLPKLNYAYNTDTAAPVAYPDADFAVMTDIHLYDTSLGTEGSAFQAAMDSDRKLLLDSADLLDYAVSDILQSSAQFVLIPGDMTKDGELLCHQAVIKELKRLTDAGKKVYVIPGNHDILNPGAFSYSGDTETPVANVTPEEFTQLYADYGYNDALERDAGSLSYVAEPVDGLWLVAIDDCRYMDNKPGGEETVGSKISQETENWIEGVLKEAQQKGKAVMVMIHHGVVEHWDGQHKLHPDYLAQDYARFGKMLASYNVRVTFTGHYHAQDITEAAFTDKTLGDKYLYDIETGALVTAPSPIRHISLRDGVMQVRSETIIDKLHPGTDFAQTSMAFVKANVVGEARKTLKKYFVSDKDADYIADAVGDAFMAHYAGDEDPAQRPAFDTAKLSLWGRIVYGMEGYVVDGLWKDLPPADNNVDLTLE